MKKLKIFSEESTQSKDMEANKSSLCSSCCEEIRQLKTIMKETRNLCIQNKAANDLIHEEILKIHHDVKSFKSSQTSVARVTDDGNEFNSFPLQTLKSINDSELLLKEQNFKETFFSFLKKLGGVDYKNSLHIMMRRIISPEVGIQFCMKGRKD